MTKKGDTLIEVCIAIGIFSLVAIGIAAVMSSGVAGSQTALETTLSREEIDAQADALRFIHESRMREQDAGYTSETGTYSEIWDKITENAISADDPNIDIQSVIEYNPSTCASLYRNSNEEDPDERGLIQKQNGFVIDTKQLENPASAFIYSNATNYLEGESPFRETQTSPRLVYNNDGNLQFAEGLYIIAVRDSGTQMIVNDKRTESTSAYYDFYVRSCWYGADADRPTAISTVIRLYDPPEVETPIINDRDPYIVITPHNGSSPAPQLDYHTIWDHVPLKVTFANKEIPLLYPNGENEYDYRFQCWGTNQNNCNGKHYVPEQPYVTPEPVCSDNKLICQQELYAIWNYEPFTLTFHPNGGAFGDGSESTRTLDDCGAFQPCENNYTIPEEFFNVSQITRSGYRLIGWSEDPNATEPTYTLDNRTLKLRKKLDLYAVWRIHNERIVITATWSAGRTDGSSYYPDFDSYIQGTKSNGVSFLACYYDKIQNNLDGTMLAELDHDCISSCGDETYVVNTFGGRNYYYYILNRSGSFATNNLKVVVHGEPTSQGGVGNHEFYSKNASGSGSYWNVFAFKNGKLVVKNTLGSIDTWY